MVATDRLVDELWGETAPATADKIVHNYVSQLRKSLEGEDGQNGLLVTHGRGYLLRLEGGQLDLARFEELASEGRRALAAGALKKAAKKLREALALWRGPALADFTYERFAQTEIARLEERRLAALEDRIEADLALGRHGELVAELEALVARSPLRERLRGQLMLALYRSGRQADALSGYRAARRTLVEELGLEPGRSLQQLEQAILRQDRALDLPVAREEEAAPPSGQRVHPRTRILLATAAALAVAIGAVAFGLTRSREAARPTLIAPNSVGVLDVKTGEIMGRVAIPGNPTLVAAGPESVWVESDTADTISLIDPATRAVERIVVPDADPTDLVVEGGAAWLVDGERRVLVKIDPVYGVVERRVRIPGPPPTARNRRARLAPAAVAVGGGAVWVTDGSTRLFRFDPGSGRLLKAIDLRRPLDDVAVGAGSVWTISGPSATVIELNPKRGTVLARIPIVALSGSHAPFPIAVAAGEGFVWTLNANTATVTKIDPRLRGVAATIPIGVERNPTALAVGGGAVWVANSSGGSVTQIDVRTHTVRSIATGSSPQGIAVAAGTVWVAIRQSLKAEPDSAAGVASGLPAPLRPLPESFCSPVYFRGRGAPDYLIASDLPLQGAFSQNGAQINQASKFVLARRGFRAGRFSIGYQSCDGGTARGAWAPEKCSANASAYAASRSVIGVIGPFTSGCAQIEIPIANRAPGGPLGMISASTTYVGLTHAGPETAPGEPAKYYPTGRRNFVRVIAADDVQAAADALLARELGVKTVYILYGDESYGLGIASHFKSASTRLGIGIAGFRKWNSNAWNYHRLALEIKRSGAEGVFLGGSVDANGVKLIQDLRAVLAPGVRIIAPDGFLNSALPEVAGHAAEGMTVSIPGIAPSELKGAGKRFVAAFAKTTGALPDTTFAIYAAQATEILLDAIARSDGTRASVTAHLFRTKVKEGIVGSFRIDANGDTTSAAVTVFEVGRGELRLLTVITPPRTLVAGGA